VRSHGFATGGKDSEESGEQGKCKGLKLAFHSPRQVDLRGNAVGPVVALSLEEMRRRRNETPRHPVPVREARAIG
jgi:hypothetical protein